MKIETKFQIGDLVKHKYQRGINGKDNSPIAAVVLYIHTETCTAGTQVFYNLRWLYQLNKYDMAIKQNDIVDIVPGGDPAQSRFREEELEAISEEARKVITQEV